MNIHTYILNNTCKAFIRPTLCSDITANYSTFIILNRGQQSLAHAAPTSSFAVEAHVHVACGMQ